MKDFEVKFREKEEGSNYNVYNIRCSRRKRSSIAKIADDLVEDEIVISPIYKMVKEYPEDTERDIYQRVTCSHHLNP